MNFDFSDDQKLLQTATRDFLEDRAPLSVDRAVLEAGEAMSESLWQGAAEMGWLGAIIPEAYGGGGFGYLELVLIAEEIGRALAPIPFGSSQIPVEALLLAGREEQKARYLPGFAEGTRIGALALAESAGVVRAERIAATYRNGTLSGRKLAVADGVSANVALVAARSTAGVCLVLAELDGDAVQRRATASIDPTRQCAEIVFDNAPAELIGDEGEGWATLQRVLDRAAVIQAFEQLGAAQRAFDITREQILDRHAFGRSIASFQAIKHRMAELYATIELARSNCFYGAWALANDAEALPVAAATARVSACDAFTLASEEMVQLHGGVGFTWEYDCHLFYRRAKHLGLALGSASEWRDKLVEHLATHAAA